ncbi:MAG: cell wall-binding repeat-containing protein, partial [Firmicutes bacterium]|nr:cell wall-binding repeat-containing protein [Bacillota bacterium]
SLKAGLKSLSAALVVLLLLSLFVGTALAESGVSRIGGADRYETSAFVALDAFKSSHEVLIARGDAEGQFADALAASVLAGALEAPILLTRPGSLPESVAEAIKDLGAEEAIVLGGEGAVSGAVVKELEDLGLEVKRVSGKDRYETAVKIAEETAGLTDTADFAFIVNGAATADSLAAGAAAFVNVAPILQVRKDSIPAVTEKAISDLEVSRLYIVGGEGVVSKAVAEDLEDLADVEERLSGADRYGTSVSVAEEMFAGEDCLVLTAGHDQNLADAVSASVFGLPILYTRTGSIPEAVEDYLDSVITASSEIRIIGGKGAVSGDVWEDVVLKIDRAKDIYSEDLEDVEAAVEAINNFNDSVQVDAADDKQAREDVVLEALEKLVEDLEVDLAVILP